MVGSGAAGGILAKEFCTNVFSVAVLDEGPYLTEAGFSHDARRLVLEDLLTTHPKSQPATVRKSQQDRARQPRAGRSACVNCGFCLGFGCEVKAKSSSLASMIPLAERSDKCEIRPNSYVHKIEIDEHGRATGAVYFDEKKNVHLQRAKAVILSANGAETPRLLLLSASNKFPNGLANSSGYVGKNLMFNTGVVSVGVFEEQTNDYKGFAVSRILHDFYELDAQKVGFYGGGGLDARFDMTPIGFALGGLPAGTPRWGKDFKSALAHNFTRTFEIFGHGTSLPVEDNSFSVDPDLKDAWGLPALRLTYKDHPDDLKLEHWLADRSVELLDAAGAKQKWTFPIDEQQFGVHLLGTCRMGDDPKTSVINPDHQTHDVKNLFICDGSSLVTSCRGQPTMTIMALAFRASDRIMSLAKRGDLQA